MRRIETEAHLVEGLDALVAADPRLVPIRAFAAEVPLRRTRAGFASLASVIVSQQVSRASADAIFGRLTQLVHPLEPETLLAAGEQALIDAGLSRAKQRALVAVAGAARDGTLDFDALCLVEAAEAIARMTEIPGIGPWTAEVYLLVAAGHPDVFPARDVALQAAVAHGFGLDARPDARSLAEMAESWAPLRAVAARLFWAYYRQMKGREAAPLP
ncbi:DNA-3-methyladenine glycosylase [Nitratireductor sp. ZSWI3]|uniref:DNA-3-methyladenine glycosylase family protein n=1 Tax=Nitratireductor sp. ZSWI3 TaxID=2966359 RepID=UPI0021502283|nr:DNA-3-methyladenine glycosylase [Nitratireductor sp. ZSWI3]MCR4265532.1 DNA-3-methyladenine glycosylase [Nitratireductor sp. ZSWI3]